jgi:DNA-binding response OmpR family regulator
MAWWDVVGHHAAVRLLVVEDDPVLRAVLRRGLGEEGHAVDAEGSVAAADEALSVNSYDIVLLDVGLPDGDGLRCAGDWPIGPFAPDPAADGP